MDKNQKTICSFCGRPQFQVDRMIAGVRPGVYICDDCVALCMDMLFDREDEESDRPSPGKGKVDLKSPKEIKAFLDEYVIGQEQAKKVLSVAVYNHYKRVNTGSVVGGVELAKSNILMLGPTGSGKTYLAQTIARLLDVPFAIADATSLTEAGYVGEDVENILLKLIQAADYDIKRAEVGIIYIDEIDKITKKSENVSITRDVSGEGVQQALLKIIEGCDASVPPQGGRKHPHQEMLEINTNNILFICGGAFDGLEKIVEDRLGANAIGFKAQLRSSAHLSVGEAFSKVLPQDLIKYGLIPEFIGRLPVTVSLDGLDVAALRDILTKPKNALVKQYQKLLELDGVRLVFSDDAIDEIAKESFERKIGARGLRSIVEKAMLDVMFDIPSDETVGECLITKDVITGDAQPRLTYRAEEVRPAKSAARRKKGPEKTA